MPEAGRLLLFVLTALLSSCTADTRPSYFLFSEGSDENAPPPLERAAQTEEWTGSAPVVLHEVGRIGFARIVGDSLVGIFDTFACQAHLMRLSQDTVATVVRVGRCGDGPGELRGADDMVLVGDTLILVDHDRTLLSFHSVSEDGARILPLNVVHHDGWRASQILLVSDQELWLNGSMAPGVPSETGLIRRVSRGDGELLDASVNEAGSALTNQAPLLQQVFACGLSGRDRILIANRWRVERALLTSDFDVVGGPSRSDLDWVSEAPMPDERPGVRPNAFVRVACGEDRTFLQWRTLADANTVDRYYLEIRRGDDFAVVHQEHGRQPGPDHPSAYTIVGPMGDGWLGYTNQGDRGPVLRVFHRR